MNVKRKKMAAEPKIANSGFTDIMKSSTGDLHHPRAAMTNPLGSDPDTIVKATESESIANHTTVNNIRNVRIIGLATHGVYNNFRKTKSRKLNLIM